MLSARVQVVMVARAAGIVEVDAPTFDLSDSTLLTTGVSCVVSRRQTAASASSTDRWSGAVLRRALAILERSEGR